MKKHPRHPAGSAQFERADDCTSGLLNIKSRLNISRWHLGVGGVKTRFSLDLTPAGGNFLHARKSVHYTPRVKYHLESRNSYTNKHGTRKTLWGYLSCPDSPSSWSICSMANALINESRWHRLAARGNPRESMTSSRRSPEVIVEKRANATSCTPWSWSIPD